MINKWIVVKEPNDIYLLKCSSCGFSLTSYEGEDPAARGLYHCPWCGTRLIDPDGEEEYE